MVDEAFADFEAVETLGPHLRPGLVVLRSFGKTYGLAGLRVGYALGPVPILDAARSTAIPLSVTGPAGAAAIASLDVERELLGRVTVIAERRDTAWRALGEQGWNIPNPQGNFLWLPTGEQTTEVADRLFDAGLVVRAFQPDGIRVSIGEEAAVEELLRIAADIVGNLPTGNPARRLG